MADDIAESAALGVEHFHAPFGLGSQINPVFQSRFRRRGEAVFDVFMTLAEHLQIGSQNQRRAIGRLRAANQVFHKFLIAHHIKLKPERRAGIFRHVFNRANRHGRQRKRHAEFFRRTRRQNLAVGMLHAGEAGGRNRRRHAHILADHFGCQAAAFHIHQHFLAEFDVLKIGGVFTIRGFRPRAGIGIIVKHFRHFTLGHAAQIFDAGHFAQIAFHRSTFRVIVVMADV